MDISTKRLSLVIPVYNSVDIVAQTIVETVSFCEANHPNYELILVNDGSRDSSWQIVAQHAHENSHIIAVDLLKNYGQHIAIYCGFEQATGDYVVTLDDDLQNPPAEIAHLLSAALEHDLVFGRFRKKQHAAHRRFGSWVVLQINRRIFSCPDDLIVSNFRLLHREVVDRILNHRALYPYITGLSLLYAVHPGNVWVEHHARTSGDSTYTLLKLVRFVLRIVFTYSSYPLWVVALGGGGLVGICFLIGLVVLINWTLTGQSPETGLLLLIFFSIFISLLTLIGLCVIIGEYVVRMVRWMTTKQLYIIREQIN